MISCLEEVNEEDASLEQRCYACSGGSKTLDIWTGMFVVLELGSEGEQTGIKQKIEEKCVAEP